MVLGKQSLQGYESNRRHADGVGVEKIPRNHNVGPPREDSKSKERDLQCEPEHFNDRIIFMSMHKEIQKYVNTIHRQVANYARKFPRGHWSFLEPGWYGTYTDKLDESWDQTAENMMKNFSESGHPLFRASSAFGRGELRSKGGGKKFFSIQW